MSNIEILLLTLLVPAFNAALGAVVWASLEDENQELLSLYREAPLYLGDFWCTIARFLTLNLWPVIVFFYLKSVYRDRKEV